MRTRWRRSSRLGRRLATGGPWVRAPQRREFREYLAGLSAPRDQNKTLTALVGAEPVTGARYPAVQRLQFFL